MLLVIDTNIIVNAIKSSNPNSKSVQLLRDVMLGKQQCVFQARSWMSMRMFFIDLNWD